MPKKCCLPNCKVQRDDPDGLHLSFYTIPADENLRKKWMDNITEYYSLEFKKYSYLCSRHFQKDCFESTFPATMNRKLKRGSCPTIFLDFKSLKQLSNNAIRQSCNVSSLTRAFKPSNSTIANSDGIEDSTHVAEINQPSCFKFDDIQIKYEEMDVEVPAENIYIEIKKEVNDEGESCIKTEDIEIKYQETDEEEWPVENYDIELRKVENKEEDMFVYPSKVFIDTEAIKSEYDPLAIPDNECNECEHRSVSEHCEACLKLLKEPSQVHIYTCNKCKYETGHKYRLIRHQLRHKNPSQLKMYSCGQCDYKSIKKGNVKQHELRHRDPSQLQKYECDDCPYETVHKYELKRHQLRHKDPSQVKMHPCDKCKFTTKHRSSLKIHQLKHKDPSQMYRCDKCKYETKYKYLLKRHQLKHKDCSSVNILVS